jgi:hypothetical protein
MAMPPHLTVSLVLSCLIACFLQCLHYVFLASQRRKKNVVKPFNPLQSVVRELREFSVLIFFKQETKTETAVCACGAEQVFLGFTQHFRL